MKKQLVWIFSAFVIMAMFQCKPTATTTKTKDTDKEHYLSDNQKISYLSIDDAKVAINTDKEEGFFEKIKKLDMEIQMSKSVEGSRADVLTEYKKHLEKSVLEFSEEEKKFVNAVFDRAYKLCNIVSPDIFPSEIKLIKGNANHYGAGVFYTRDNCIIIPEDNLYNHDSDDFLKTTLHEIFHIYSRYNREKQQKLYARIGYKPLETLPIAPEILESRILLNPDGVNYGYYLDVMRKESEKPIKVVPIIYSKYLNYTPGKSDFFEYLHFEMYSIKSNNQLETTRNGESTVRIKDIVGFFEQIGTNTEYIIHPDEVLADNFVLLCLSKDDENTLDEFKIREKGKKLITDIGEIIAEK